MDLFDPMDFILTKVDRPKVTMTVVKYLVEHGANVNKADEFGKTPLVRASDIGYGDIISISSGT